MEKTNDLMDLMIIKLDGIEKTIKIDTKNVFKTVENNVLRVFVKQDADKRVFSFKEAAGDDRTVFQSVIDTKIIDIAFYNNEGTTRYINRYDVARKNCVGIMKDKSLYIEVIISDNFVTKV